VRVVIAQDMTLLREGLTRLLADAGSDVAGGAGDLPACSSWPTGRRRTRP
jgi:hypothetical protein